MVAEPNVAVQQCHFLDIPLGMRRQASTRTPFEYCNVHFQPSFSAWRGECAKGFATFEGSSLWTFKLNICQRLRRLFFKLESDQCSNNFSSCNIEETTAFYQSIWGQLTIYFRNSIVGLPLLTFPISIALYRYEIQRCSCWRHGEPSTIRPCFSNLKSDFLILLEDADADLLNSIPRSFGSIAKSIPNRWPSSTLISTCSSVLKT